MAIRTIYMIEEYTEDGDLVFRRFARNRKTAERIAKEGKAPIIRKLQKAEMGWVNTKEVE